MDYFALQEQLSRRLNKKRYQHSIGVSMVAEQLAKIFGASVEKAKLAGLLHDCAREFSVGEMVALAESMNIDISEVERSSPILLHAYIGEQLVESQYGVNDLEIKRAIRLHTTGGTMMSDLDKIIYLADMIEPGRDFPEVGMLRKLAQCDLDQAILAAFNQSIQYVIRQNQVIHPDTMHARNEILLKGLF